MRKIGFHLSIAGGIYNSIIKANKLNINALQIFLKNSNRWIAKEYSDENIKKYFEEKQKYSDLEIFAHSAYLINLAAEPGDTWNKSVLALVDEIKRADTLSIPWIVIHPGSHKEKGEEWGIKRVVETLDIVFEKAENSKAGILLETTAGQGSNLGYKFEHLRDIIQLSKNKDRLAVCFDTCHLFAAGYDLLSENSINNMLDSFENLIGLEKLKLIHLNDTKFGLASKKDRHEHIGQGLLGENAIKLILNNRRLKNVPFIMETPKDKTKDELYSDRLNLEKVLSLIED